MRCKELDCRINIHAQDFTDVFTLAVNTQRVWVESQAMAAVTGYGDVRYKAHLHGQHAAPSTLGATALTGIKGKARGVPTAHACLACLGKEAANGIPKANIGGGAGPRGLADGGLVNLEDTLQGLPALHGLAVLPAGANRRGGLWFGISISPRGAFFLQGEFEVFE